MKVLLLGHPNVGKSVLFNRLTGANIVESNYPGTTVDFTRGSLKLGDEKAEIVDVPGTFSLAPHGKAEQVAVRMLEEYKSAVVVCVLDSTKIERGLYLVLSAIEAGYRVIVALNMWDEARQKNIRIDAQKLEDLLGVPVVPTVAISGEGVKELVDKLKEAHVESIGRIADRATEPGEGLTG